MWKAVLIPSPSSKLVKKHSPLLIAEDAAIFTALKCANI
jgi:hypothetical protein